MKNQSVKAADVLVDSINRLDWNPHLFAGNLMDQPVDVQRRIVDSFVVFIKVYKRNADNPHLRYRTDPHARAMIVEVDLTEFDQP